MLRQSLQQKLLQKLSPQQIQFIKLLQVPTAMLDARIKEELEENPALEDESLSIAEVKNEYDFDEDNATKSTDDAEEEYGGTDEFDIDQYIQDDDQKDYDPGRDSGDYDEDAEEKKERPLTFNSSFHESLVTQLNLCVLDDKSFLVASQIVGSIDDDGYLRRGISAIVDDLAFTQNITTTDEEAEQLLHLIQTFDPAGVGARDLRECLLLQLKRKENRKSIQLATEVIDHHLDEFTKKHYEKLERSLEITHEQLRDAINEILKLNPKPGDNYSESSKQQQIIPDFIITKNDSNLLLTLNSRNAPELKVSRQYKEMFQTYDKQSEKDKKLKEAVLFVKQKLDSARWFIDAIKQRQQTLLKTMNAIMQYQYEYFLDGDERNLKPMILKDIAERIDMDISTVSRVANSKYVQTEFGTYLLKSFFSESITTDSGEEVSNREVKKILENCIGSEDKHSPLADEKLADILQEQGYNIARRTVAKYREQMGIPVARMRKEM